MVITRRKSGDTGFYEPYVQYARTLRAWFVAYGIGVPVLLVSQDAIAKAILATGTGNRIAWLFLCGVLIQIIVTFLYKYSMEYLYFDETDSKELKGTMRLKIAVWLSNAIWFEIFLDLISLLLFAYGTFLVVAAVLSQHS